MTHKVMQAMRLIEAFAALMRGQRVPITWADRASTSIASGAIVLPRPKTGEAAEVALLTRLAVHETGHLDHTEPIREGKLTETAFEYWNAMEDPRMERAQCDTYPGAKIILARGLDEMLAQLDVPRLVEHLPHAAVSLQLLMRGFLALAPHAPVQRHAPAVLEQTGRFLTQGKIEAIEAAISRLQHAISSLDVERIASELDVELKKPEQPEPLQRQQQEQAADQDQQEDASSPDCGGGDAFQQQQPSGGESSAENEQSQDSDGAAIDADSGSDAGEAEQGAEHDDVRASEGAAVPGEHDAEGCQAEMAAEGRRDDIGEHEKDFESPPQADGQESPDQREQRADAQPPDGNGQSAKADMSGENESGDQGAQSQPAGGDQEHDGGHVGNQQTGHPQGDAQERDAQQGSDVSQNKAPGQGGNRLDLGALLREVLAEAYGTGEAGQEALVPKPVSVSDQQIAKLAEILAQNASGEDAEGLLERSLALLVEGEGGETPALTTRSPGAAMCLAGASSGSGPQADHRSMLQGVEARLVTVLQRELQDRRRRPTRLASNGSRVLGHRFWRLSAMGDTRLFAQQKTVTGLEAAATILVDSSESMAERLSAALQTALAFSLALQRINVRTRVIRFPGMETVTEVLQHFGESARSCSDRVKGLEASGGTPIGAACASELPLLLQQNRLKRFMVVITDDGPGDAALLHQVQSRAAQSEALVLGIGIGCDIRDHIPRSVGINNVSELPAALAELFRIDMLHELTA